MTTTDDLRARLPLKPNKSQMAPGWNIVEDDEGGVGIYPAWDTQDAPTWVVRHAPLILATPGLPCGHPHDALAAAEGIAECLWCREVQAGAALAGELHAALDTVRCEAESLRTQLDELLRQRGDACPDTARAVAARCAADLHLSELAADRIHTAVYGYGLAVTESFERRLAKAEASTTATALATDAGARVLAAMRQAETAIAARIAYWDDDHAPDEDAGTTEHALREALAAIRAVLGGGT